MALLIKFLEWIKLEIYNDIWTVYYHIFPNGKYYVGITSRDVETRWGKNGIGYKDQPVYKAINKYGWNNITHEVFGSHLTKEEATNMEKILINKLDSYNNGYNYTYGGDGDISYSNLERKNMIDLWRDGHTIHQISQHFQCHPSTVRRVLREYNITDEELHKRGFDHSNKKQDEQILILWKEKYKLIDIANKLNINMKTVTRALNRLNIPVEQRLGNCGTKKCVLQYDQNGNFIAEFESMQAAARSMNIDSMSNISRSCKRLEKPIKAYGYYWRFKNEQEIPLHINVR